jgi:hypothetical protein
MQALDREIGSVKKSMVYEVGYPQWGCYESSRILPFALPPPEEKSRMQVASGLSFNCRLAEHFHNVPFHSE